MKSNLCSDVKSLKALCHAIRADYLLMNLHAPTQQMKTGRGGWIISSRLIFKSAVSSIVCAL